MPRLLIRLSYQLVCIVIAWLQWWRDTYLFAKRTNPLPRAMPRVPERVNQSCLVLNRSRSVMYIIAIRQHIQDFPVPRHVNIVTV